MVKEIKKILGRVCPCCGRSIRSQAWLGSQVGVSAVTVNYWLSGKYEPTSENKVRILAILEKENKEHNKKERIYER